MSFYQFIGIFLSDEEKEKVKEDCGLRNIYPHFHCNHVTLDHKPSFIDVKECQSGRSVTCYATHFLQDSHIQTLVIDIPFSCKKRLTHMTFAINSLKDAYSRRVLAGLEDPAAEAAITEQSHLHDGSVISEAPACKPFYSNSMINRFRNIERWQLPPRQDTSWLVHEYREPIAIDGSLGVYRGKGVSKGGWRGSWC